MGHDVGDEKVMAMTPNNSSVGLFRLIIVIILMLLIIIFVMKAYFNNKPIVDAVNFEMEQRNFTHTLSLIKAQWLLEGRQSEVEFVFFDQHGEVKNSQIFKVSNLGWPSINNTKQSKYCLALWATVINVEVNEASVRVLTRANHHKNGDIECQICDATSSASCLTYSTLSGI